MLRRMGSKASHKTCLWSRAQRRQRVCPAPFSTSIPVSSVERAHVPTPIEKFICDSIRASGPIPVSNYIQLCLSHPTEGYYMKKRSDDSDVFGLRGDFITSPEISQVFGELVCLWLLSMWRDSDTAITHPKIRLIELGPGRGTLMDDILRTLSIWPDSKAAVKNVHLVENSSSMRSRQDQELSAWRGSQNTQLHWWGSIEDIPDASEDEFTMLVAHEFFDALPVNILEKTASGFREVLIDLKSQSNPSVVPSSTASNSAMGLSPLQFVVSSGPTARSDLLSTLSPRFASLPEGSRVEVCSSGWRIARKVGEMVSSFSQPVVGGSKRRTNKGAALIIDYGGEHTFGASFRAFRAHQHVHVFDKPGQSDLTTNVDFALLKDAIKDIATTHGTMDQATFLMRMGIHQRITALLRTQKEERRSEILRAGQRLVDTSGQGMGRVYRVLGISSMVGGQKACCWPFVSLDGNKPNGQE
ncbi:DUF185-domain-containing protein [Ramaria rubella]|nr:DUF185-domain-containing protein [Ramaria rubella]